LSTVVQCSNMIWVEGVEDAVVAVSSHSNWRAIEVNNFHFRVVSVATGVCVEAAIDVVDSVRIVSAAADKVGVVVVILDEAAIVIEVSADELAAEVCRVSCGEVADAIESLVSSSDIDASSSVCVQRPVASRSGDNVSSLLVCCVAGSIVRVGKVAGLLISLDHHRACFNRNSNCSAWLFFLLVVSASATTAESKSDVSAVLVAAASPV